MLSCIKSFFLTELHHISFTRAQDLSKLYLLARPPLMLRNSKALVLKQKGFWKILTSCWTLQGPIGGRSCRVAHSLTDMGEFIKSDNAPFKWCRDENEARLSVEQRRKAGEKNGSKSRRLNPTKSNPSGPATLFHCPALLGSVGFSTATNKQNNLNQTKRKERPFSFYFLSFFPQRRRRAATKRCCKMETVEYNSAASIAKAVQLGKRMLTLTWIIKPSKILNQWANSGDSHYRRSRSISWEPVQLKRKP